MSIADASPLRATVARVQSVEALRGISALMVVGYHYAGVLNGVYAQGDFGNLLFGGGWVGVDLFFLISGFVMVFVTQQRREARVVPFLIKRMVRVFPMTWLATVAYFFAIGGRAGDLYATKAAWADPLFDASFLIVTWTIRFEMVFYVAFAAGFVISHRYRTLATSALIIGTWLLVQTLGGIELSLHPDESAVSLKDFAVDLPLRSVLLTLGNPLSLEFVAGMLLGELYLWTSKLDKARFQLPHYAVLIAACLFLAGFASNFHCAFKPDRLVRALPYCLLLMTAVLMAESSNPRARISPVLVSLGELTFSIYLFHEHVMHMVPTLPYLMHFRGVSGFCLWVGITLCIAWLSYNLAEKPFVALGRRTVRWVERRWPRVASFPERPASAPVPAS